MHGMGRRVFTPITCYCIFGLLLAAVTLLAYQPAWNGGFIWDDDKYITDNELLTAPDGLWRIWFSLDSPSQYFPLIYTTFRVEHALWGLNPAGYHWVNLLFHVANALLVWRILTRLKVPGAWLAAAIFALHPVQVESVAWITERKNVLMGFFFLLTLLAWIAFINEGSTRRWRFYSVALVLYALALAAKTTACTLPAALFLILWLQKKPVTLQRVLQIVPFFVLGIVTGLLAIWWERYHQGTSRALFTFLSPIDRLLVASRAVWFYASKLVWPSNLTFIYPRWDISPSHPLGYAWVLAGAVLCVAIYFARRYTGRSVEVATLFFVATLGPVLGFIMLYTFRYTFVADHYQYLACIGPIALVSAGVVRVAAEFKKGAPFILSAAVCVVAILTGLTWRQSAMYGDTEALWRTTLATNPGCWMAHNNLGLVYRHKGAVDEAIAHYHAALEMRPDSAEIYFNLGSALLEKGQIDEATRHFQKALELSPSYMTHKGLGVSFAKGGKIDAAILHFQEALRLQPHDPQAHADLAAALAQDARLDEAITHWHESLKIRPDNVKIENDLATCLLKKGQFKEAAVQWQRAVELQPDNADMMTNRGVALSLDGRVREAIAVWEKALALQPDKVTALNNLAWALATSADASARDGAKAVRFASKLLQLSGGSNPKVLRTVAAAYAESRRFPEAIAMATRGLELANAQGNISLANELERNIALYRANSSLHDIPLRKR
jgi:protein O-mannosyl-transferase